MRTRHERLRERPAPRLLGNQPHHTPTRFVGPPARPLARGPNPAQPPPAFTPQGVDGSSPSEDFAKPLLESDSALRALLLLATKVAPGRTHSIPGPTPL